MSGPSVYLTSPPRELFKFPPDPQPVAIPPYTEDVTMRVPFNIDPAVYQAMLSPWVPLTIASCYIVAVQLVNAYNRQFNFKKPWWISTTRPFYVFVIAHNVFLAVYSAATFVGMGYGLLRMWPGFDSSNGGVVGIVDSYCKIHGPRGYGDAVTYNSTLNIWEAKNSLVKMLPSGIPDPTDVGRMWNEGLAFWGWWFYLSKFYEVLDTVIIVAKGNRSATLQTYHHAGAMICMWAGIRYMSPPIVMFVVLNSFIHSLMYTYFTVSALKIKVPMKIKRTLTTMQITQFVVGSSFAAVFLFIRYDIPVLSSYKITHTVSSLASAASSAVVDTGASVASAAVAAAPTWDAVLRKMLLRAIGDEGVAANVRDRSNQVIMPGVQEAVQRIHEETRYRTEYQTVNCIDTTGQAFAIWLNLVYLAPLTFLFVRFFVKSYIKRSNITIGGRRSSRGAAAAGAVFDGAKGVRNSLNKLGRSMEKSPERVVREVQSDVEKMRSGKYNEKANGHANGGAK